MTHEMYAEPGDVVEYFFGGDTNGDVHPAIIIGIGMGSKVVVGRLDPAMTDHQVIDGVPHVDDKSTAQVEKIEAGGWRHPKRVLAMRKAMFDLGLAKWNEKDRRIDYLPESDSKAPQIKKSA